MQLVAAILICLLAGVPSERRYEESRVSMGCVWSIVIDGRQDKPRRLIVDEAFNEIDRIDRLMSNYKPSSELSRINREAGHGPVAIDPELFDFIELCLSYSERSEGAFDITVGALMKTWGFFRAEGRLPSDAEIEAARKKTGYRHVILNQNGKTIRFDVQGLELDLGGIGKGYAVDRAVEVLRRHGITRALVNGCGSTIYGLGAPEDAQGWEIEIEDPLDHRKTARKIRLQNQALSVSGGYGKYFEVNGVRYSHILDPRNGRPARGVSSVAVITATGVDGDALDNVFYVLGPRRSRELAARFPPAGTIYFGRTSGL
ncbi:MAG: FAD:protein FMN transferase [Acidobacteriota bacterium]|nr:MAG: FAD:protein FMN transferase [Acidobacteriota bacterium]